MGKEVNAQKIQDSVYVRAVKESVYSSIQSLCVIFRFESYACLFSQSDTSIRIPRSPSMVPLEFSLANLCQREAGKKVT